MASGWPSTGTVDGCAQGTHFLWQKSQGWIHWITAPPCQKWSGHTQSGNFLARRKLAWHGPCLAGEYPSCSSLAQFQNGYRLSISICSRSSLSQLFPQKSPCFGIGAFGSYSGLRSDLTRPLANRSWSCAFIAWMLLPFYLPFSFYRFLLTCLVLPLVHI